MKTRWWDSAPGSETRVGVATCDLTSVPHLHPRGAGVGQG